MGGLVSGVRCFHSFVSLSSNVFGVIRFEFDPCPRWRGVGLSYSSGLPHFFLEHRLCFSAEEQMFRLGDPCQLRASRVCDAAD